MKRFCCWFALLCCVTTCPAAATVYQISPQGPIKNLSEIAARLQAGDRVEISPGIYRDTARLTANGTAASPIVIIGVGTTRPVFDAQGLNTSGRGPIPRGILQIEGAYWKIENLEFKNARNGENAAGIRLLHSTNATISHCKITECDMGIFGDDQQTATIEDCDIGFNSTLQHNGYAHNFYMAGNRVLVRHCWIHDSLFGQNFKSRAHFNELWYNWIDDSNEGEVGPVDSKGETDRPYSNTLLVGNVIISSPNRSGNHWKYILFGTESGGSHQGTLYLTGNILVARDPRIQFIRLADPAANLVATHNFLMGSNTILTGVHTPGPTIGEDNWITPTMKAPDGWTGTQTGADPGFVNVARQDFHLKPGGEAMKLSHFDFTYRDGENILHSEHFDPGKMFRSMTPAGPVR